MVTTALAQRTQFHQSVLASHITPYSPRAQEMLSGTGTALWQAGSNMVLAKTQAAGLVYGLVQQQSAMMAFVDCFWLQMLVMLAVIPLVFIIQKARGSETGLPVH